MELDNNIIELLRQTEDGKEIIVEQKQTDDEEGEMIEEIFEFYEIDEDDDNNDTDQGETIEQIEREVQEGLLLKQEVPKSNGHYVKEDTMKLLAGKVS